MEAPDSTFQVNSEALQDVLALDTEKRLQLAVQAILDSPMLPNGHHKLSLREACAIYNVVRGTLDNRLKGLRKTRKESHLNERLLADEEEAVLVEWVKSLGRRGLPVTASMLRDYASDISGTKIGINWPYRFLERHPDLKVKKTSALEECRARSLNPIVVDGFFKLLEDVIEEHHIPVGNIYNADEKGIQLGIGKSVAAIVDRSQKTVNQVEYGNREMVTIIETVCADGTSLAPSVIFQGKRQILEWGKENPGNASISVSESGWTDQELGVIWLKKHFHPLTQDRNPERRYRLLIIDGHTSHTTYDFCRFADLHEIIVLCLPSHTTHALQPCDVGVFSPLSNSWKTLVNRLVHQGTPITKYNFLKLYHEARSKALKPSTIASAFAKTGIWPLNPAAIPIEAFEPAKNTTTQAAMPVPNTLASILEPVYTSYNTSGNEAPTTATNSPEILDPDLNATLPDILDPNSIPPSLPSSIATLSTLQSDTPTDIEPAGPTPTDSATIISSTTTRTHRYRIAGIPGELHHTASRAAMREQITQLRGLLKEAEGQIARDHALKVLMEQENGILRQKLHYKNTGQKKTYTSSQSRNLTAAENLDQLALSDWKGNWKLLLKDMGPKLKARKKMIDEFEKKVAEELKKALREAKEARKEAVKGLDDILKNAVSDLERLEMAASNTRGRGRGQRRGNRGGRGRGARGRGASTAQPPPWEASETETSDTTDVDNDADAEVEQIEDENEEIEAIPQPAAAQPAARRNPGRRARNEVN